MFSSKKSSGSTTYETVTTTIIGKGITLEAALLTGKESVKIEGVFLGDVDLDGHLTLGETGVIEGFVRAKEVQIGGQMRGNIECTATVTVDPTARVTGDIRSQSIKVAEGAQLNGRSQVGEVPTPNKDAKLPESPIPNVPPNDKSFLDKSLENVKNDPNKPK